MGDSLLTTATAQMERVKRTAGPHAVDAKQAARDAKARGIARMQDMERQIAAPEGGGGGRGRGAEGAWRRRTRRWLF